MTETFESEIKYWLDYCKENKKPELNLIFLKLEELHNDKIKHIMNELYLLRQAIKEGKPALACVDATIEALR